MSDELNNKITPKPLNDTYQSETVETSDQANKKYIIIGIMIVLVLLTLIVLATIYLVNPANSDRTEQIRDVFIIFLALESLVIGIALVVLIVQLSNLINLLQNEIRPIINSTNETVNTLKGTAKFVSDNLAEPVIKINQYAAMVKRIFMPPKK
jgi:amino acid permease